MIELKTPIHFEWDKGNQDKNWNKHRVTQEEAEQVFFDTHKLITEDSLNSTEEKRHRIIGKTKAHRLLFVVFTMRGDKVRVISARDLNKRKEAKFYEKAA